MAEKTLALENALAEVHEESRKAAEAMRQAVAGKAGLSDLEVLKNATKRTFVFARGGGGWVASNCTSTN